MKGTTVRSHDELFSGDTQQAAERAIAEAGFARNILAGIVDAQGGSIFVTNEQIGRGSWFFLLISNTSREGITISVEQRWDSQA